MGIPAMTRKSTARFETVRGFSLIEIMIALTLGLLLSYGLITLFGGTSRTNKVQEGLARLQENGRFAVMQMEQDLRMLGGQYCSNTSGSSKPDTAVPMLAARAPMVYAPSLNLPDSAINSIAANGTPSSSAATGAYVLSPRWFVQGYSCSSGTCTPAVPSQIPAAGLASGSRVPGSDVLTMRYQRGTGWPVPVGACAVGASTPLASGTTITLSRKDGDDPLSNMKPGLALISDCVSPAIIPISGVAGDVLTVGGVLPGATGRLCAGNRMRDVRLFNFSDDFVTVSYYLAFRADDNPDARTNSAAAQRLIPVLIRREKGVEQELVRGVDQLAFLYGVQDSNGNTSFMTADQVNAGTNCPPPPAGLAIEPGCFWRTVRTVEAHLLVNTVDEVFGLDDGSRTYHFNDADVVATDGYILPSGLRAGSMLRREFIAYVSERNHNL
jgi:type IV pilus assembly protein PilW